MKGSKGNLLLIMMTAWICLLGSFLYWMEVGSRREEKRLAQSTASAFFQQIVITRMWNAFHGGVYVPITPLTQPNKYLQSKGRDLTADNGLRLTKINPSYMTRQIAELAKKNKTGIQFHITSLKPIRPENKATKWEERWLKSFEQGSKEHGEFFEDGDITWFRYMAPLLTGPECLACHAQQGYKVGDIRGGLSISLPYSTHTHLYLFIGFGSVAVIGLIFIFIGTTLYERKQRLFDATFNSPVPTCVTDRHYTILMANESYWAEFGARPDNKKPIKCHEHRPGTSCHTENCPLTRIMGGANGYTYETVKVFAGVSRHFIVSAKPLYDARGSAFGCVESFQEITERKRAEEALEESNRKLEALSNTDGLTEIANRRYFDKVLTQEYARHARSGAKLSLILLDIDYFKSFNDCYGHINGDECLQQVAQVMTDCITRSTDLVARYGGEEFACILPETDSRGAVAIAEKIRLELMARAIPHKCSKVADCVTASLGVATVKCSADGSAVDIVTQADELLYLAKSAGRNRVEFILPLEVEEEIKRNLVQLTWKESFCCGNQLIDSQHRSLLDISNELLEAVLSAGPSSQISRIITRLLDDVSQHFHDEEFILKSANFPGLDQHVAEHGKLLTKGLKLAEEFKASTLTVGDVFQFLAYEVVMLHMLEADREYFPYINAADETDPGPGQKA
ncbi:MAG: diguanylate cyclase [Desulfobulbaceae bacterium]|nr:diguanylate cyclase [Desulfobulbaceae bacterium]HIJ90968.1 diguanylate cyclase [Deltaproteobacteria bacterium]